MGSNRSSERLDDDPGWHARGEGPDPRTRPEAIRFERPGGISVTSDQLAAQRRQRLQFEPFEEGPDAWGELLEQLPGKLVCQSSAWLSFLKESQRGEPITAVLRKDGSIVGAFAGMVITKLGLRILGSPFPGWTTPYMGLNLVDGVSRQGAVHALVDFAFGDLGCVHLEMMDRHLELSDLDGLRYAHRMFNSWEVDLNADAASLIATFSRACRWNIRTAAKNGLVVEEANDPEFVDEYYAQLSDVFGRQGLTPTYPRQRAAQLISALRPSGQLLLLRARTSDGRPAATGIFHAVDATRAYGWGFASWRDMQHLHPNELLLFHAMNWWRERGFTIMDLAGSGEYKKKYHPRPIAVPWIRISKYAVIRPLREAAQWSYQFKRQVFRSDRPGPRSRAWRGSVREVRAW
jgi:hypothetical protein